jgi:hypothetical protein
MKSSPWQSIEAGRDTGFDNAGRVVHVWSLTCRSIKYRTIKSHAAIVGPRMRTGQTAPGRNGDDFDLTVFLSKIWLDLRDDHFPYLA